MTEIGKCLLGYCHQIALLFFLPPVHCFSALFTHAVQMMKNCFVEKERQRERETILLEGRGEKPPTRHPVPKYTHREVRERESEKKKSKKGSSCCCGLAVCVEEETE